MEEVLVDSSVEPLVDAEAVLVDSSVAQLVEEDQGAEEAYLGRCAAFVDSAFLVEKA